MIVKQVIPTNINHSRLLIEDGIHLIIERGLTEIVIMLHLESRSHVEATRSSVGCKREGDVVLAHYTDAHLPIEADTDRLEGRGVNMSHLQQKGEQFGTAGIRNLYFITALAL